MNKISRSVLLGTVISLIIVGIGFWNFKMMNDNDSINIVLFDKNVKKYIDEASEPSMDRDDVWNRVMLHNFEAITKKHVPEDEQNKAISALFKNHFNSPSSLKFYLDSSKNAEITKIIKSSFEKSKVLSGTTENEKLSVVIIPFSGTTYGITGASNFIVLYVNYLDSNEKLLKDIEGTFAHEYAHTLSLNYAKEHGGISTTYPNTFLAQMILEGKACVFASLSAGNDYDSILIPKEPIHDFEFYEDILDQEITQTSFFNYAVGEKSFTRADCYYYGIEAVEKYIEAHNNIKVEEWLYLTPEEMFNDIR